MWDSNEGGNSTVTVLPERPAKWPSSTQPNLSGESAASFMETVCHGSESVDGVERSSGSGDADDASAGSEVEAVGATDVAGSGTAAAGTTKAGLDGSTIAAGVEAEAEAEAGAGVGAGEERGTGIAGLAAGVGRDDGDSLGVWRSGRGVPARRAVRTSKTSERLVSSSRCTALIRATSNWSFLSEAQRRRPSVSPK